MKSIERPFTRRAGVAILVIVTLTVLSACERPPENAQAQAPAPWQRLNADGTPYNGSGDFASEPWSCVRDPRTGLVWEVKTLDAGLRSREHTYTWHEPDQEETGDQPGLADGGRCSGSACDTHAYTLAVRAAKLCGFDDWRVPGHTELGSLIDLRFRTPPPTIDPAYFPEAHAGAYWTITTYGFFPEGAWSWQFDLGQDRVDWKKEPKYLRLVRGTVIHKPGKER